MENSDFINVRNKLLMENSDFINERNKLLSELDNYNMDDIVNYCKKYNIKLPDDENVILAGLHKGRLYVINPIITDEMKEKSKIWLIEHGFKPFISDNEDMVMTAEEMFKELDYRKETLDDGIWYDNSDGENQGNAINFNNKKYIQLLGDFEILELDLLKAINKQVEELRW